MGFQQKSRIDPVLFDSPEHLCPGGFGQKGWSFAKVICQLFTDYLSKSNHTAAVLFPQTGRSRPRLSVRLCRGRPAAILLLAQL